MLRTRAILGGCGEQALASDGKQAAKARVTVTMKLLGVGVGTLDGFFPAFVDALAPGGEPMDIGAFAGVSPDMTDDQAGGASVRGA